MLKTLIMPSEHPQIKYSRNGDNENPCVDLRSIHLSNCLENRNTPSMASCAKAYTLSETTISTKVFYANFSFNWNGLGSSIPSFEMRVPSSWKLHNFKWDCPAEIILEPVGLNLMVWTGLDSLLTVSLTPYFQSQRKSPLSCSDPSETRYGWDGDSIIYEIPYLWPFNYKVGTISLFSSNLKMLTEGFLVAYSPVKTYCPSLEIYTAWT